MIITIMSHHECPRPHSCTGFVLRVFGVVKILHETPNAEVKRETNKVKKAK
jgi:hypothetical protein